MAKCVRAEPAGFRPPGKLLNKHTMNIHGDVIMLDKAVSTNSTIKDNQPYWAANAQSPVAWPMSNLGNNWIRCHGLVVHVLRRAAVSIGTM